MANRWSLCIGFSILLLLGTTALFAPLLAPRDPLSQNLDQDLIASSRQHPLGTDKLGRDLLSRIIYGGCVSLLVGIATVTLSLAIGVTIGSLSVYFCGSIAHLLLRLFVVF